MSKLISKVTILLVGIVLFTAFTLACVLGRRRSIILLDATGNLGNAICTCTHVASIAKTAGATTYLLNAGKFHGMFPKLDSDWLSRYPLKRGIIPGAASIRRPIANVSRHFVSILRHLPDNFLASSIILDSPFKRFDLDSDEINQKIERSFVLFLSGYGFRNYAQRDQGKAWMAELFAPNTIYEGEINQPVQYLRQRCDLVIGIVIRHAGYETYRGGKHYHSLLEYATLMDAIEKSFTENKVGYLICSDSNQDTSSFSRFTYYFRQGADLENRFSLGLCDLIATVPSSYATLPAFINDVPIYWIQDIHKTPAIDDFRKQNYVFDDSWIH